MYEIYISYVSCINYKMVTQSSKIKEEYIITKKIAKHGKQAIIVIPKILIDKLKPGTLTKLTIEVLESMGEEK